MYIIAAVSVTYCIFAILAYVCMYVCKKVSLKNEKDWFETVEYTYLDISLVLMGVC